MIIDVKVPVFAESIHTGTLLDWKKKAGDLVTRDEVLVEIETDKVVLEVPSPQSGVLKEVVKESGATVQSEELIARVDTEGTPTATREQPGQTAVVLPRAAPEGRPEPLAPRGLESVEKLGPAVRKLITERGLEPTEIPGTGRGGRITKGDVLAYLEAQQAPRPEAVSAPAAAKTETTARVGREREERRVPMTRIRARIAERLVEAQRTAAILTTFNEVNMHPVMELRNRHQKRFEQHHGVRLGFMSFFAKAVVLSLKRFPVVNASIDGGDIVYHDYYDIGIAVGSPRGLVVPVLRDIDRCSFAEIETQIAQFAEKAKTGQLTIDELSGGTFTITNGGVFGSLLSTPILNPPQSAILGMHKVQERAVVESGTVVVRPMMYLALSYDHRIVDGREAVQFLVAIKEALEDPERMLLEV